MSRASPAGLVVTPMERLLLVELDYRKAPCDQACVFCPERYVAERGGAPPPADVDAIVAEVEALVAADPRDVYLESGDVMAFPGFDRLVEAAERHGRRVFVATPGVRLADRAVVERFVGRGVRFDLTVHGATPATWRAMTGRDHVGPAVERALDLLTELRVPHRISMVVTDRNQHEVLDVVRAAAARWRPEEVALKLFAVDSTSDGTGTGHPEFLDQFPDFGVVTAALLALEGTPDLPALAIDNLPFCQLDPALPARLPLRVHHCWNTYRAYALSACAGCAAKPLCVGVHLAYVAKHRLRRPDVAAAARIAGLG